MDLGISQTENKLHPVLEDVKCEFSSFQLERLIEGSFCVLLHRTAAQATY